MQCRCAQTGHDGTAAAGTREIRAGDRDREAVIRVLQEAYAAGYLGLGELRIRAGAAWQARTQRELRALTRDLLPQRGIPESVTETQVVEVWLPRETAVRPPPATRLPALRLAILAGLAMATATWQPALLIPLIILVVPILAATLPVGGPHAGCRKR